MPIVHASPPGVGTWTLSVIVSQAKLVVWPLLEIGQSPISPPSTDGGGYGEGWGGWREKEDINREWNWVS